MSNEIGLSELKEPMLWGTPGVMEFFERFARRHYEQGTYAAWGRDVDDYYTNSAYPALEDMSAGEERAQALREIYDVANAPAIEVGVIVREDNHTGRSRDYNLIAINPRTGEIFPMTATWAMSSEASGAVACNAAFTESQRELMLEQLDAQYELGINLYDS